MKRQNLRNYDYKYIMNPSRRLWTSSVYPIMIPIVNIINGLSLTRTLEEPFTYVGSSNFNPDVDPDLDLEHISDTFLYDVSTISTTKVTHIFSFFGGICFELLNNAYPDTNLYDFVDPTSDIDALLYINPKNLTKDGCIASMYYVNNGNHTITEYVQQLVNSITTPLVNQLTEMDLYIKNSVPFDINEYDIAPMETRTTDLGWMVYEIPTTKDTHIKVITFFDSSYKTFRIQIILKIGDLMDHVFELLISIPSRYGSTYNPYVNIVSNSVTYPISTIKTLLIDNLQAYDKRKTITESDVIHKPINHVGRIIYLFNALKTNNNFYNVFLGNYKLMDSNGLILPPQGILTYLFTNRKANRMNNAPFRGVYQKEYQTNDPNLLYNKWFYYKRGLNNELVTTYLHCEEIYIAFYSLFYKILPASSHKQLDLYNNALIIDNNPVKITPELEEYYYHKIINTFVKNASTFNSYLSTFPIQPNHSTLLKNRLKETVKKSPFHNYLKTSSMSSTRNLKPIKSRNKTDLIVKKNGLYSSIHNLVGALSRDTLFIFKKGRPDKQYTEINNLIDKYNEIAVLLNEPSWEETYQNESNVSHLGVGRRMPGKRKYKTKKNIKRGKK